MQMLWKTTGQFLKMLNMMLLCCSHAFQETDSLRKTMQIVECSLLYYTGGPKAESPLSQGP